MARSSDTRLSEILEFNRGDSELALGESGMGSLLDLSRVPPKRPRLEGLIIRAPLEPFLSGGGGAVTKPAVSHTNSMHKSNAAYCHNDIKGSNNERMCKCTALQLLSASCFPWVYLSGFQVLPRWSTVTERACSVRLICAPPL